MLSSFFFKHKSVEKDSFTFLFPLQNRNLFNNINILNILQRHHIP